MFNTSTVQAEAAVEMTSRNGIQASDRDTRSDLKMDEVNFEPTSIPTRRDYMRKILSDRIAEDLKRKLTVPPISEEKNLQGTKKVHHTYIDKRQSIWSEIAHPTRGFKRTGEFTKPDSEYFGASQWR